MWTFSNPFSINKLIPRLFDPVIYCWEIENETIECNAWIGRHLSIVYRGVIHCIHCGDQIQKSFNRGSCYPCFRKKASNDLCIMKPETCHYDLGTCREPDWAATHCLIPHTVYLTNTSGLKVGITRSNRFLNRWMDQGAVQGIALGQVNNRLESGVVECAFKSMVKDKTNWRTLLKGEPPWIDLFVERKRILEFWPKKIAYQEPVDGKAYAIHYPVLEYLEKINSLSLDKSPTIQGKLLGIKGQYLILDCGVFNVHKHTGYVITMVIQ